MRYIFNRIRYESIVDLYMETFYPDITSSVDLGVGFNSLLNRVGTSSVLKKGVIKPSKKDLGQDLKYNKFVSTSVEELQTSIDVSASASVSGIWGKVSGRTEFFQSVGKKRSYTYLTVRTRVLNTEIRMGIEAPQISDFTDDVREYLEGKHPRDAFYRTYGDCYVHSYQTGGDFMAVMEFQTEDQNSQREVKADLNVAANAWGQDINVSANFKNSIQSASKSSTMRILVYRAGGAEEVPDVDKLVDAARRFPDTVNPDKRGKPVIISVNVNDYAQLFPLKFQKEAPVLTPTVLRRWKKLASMYNYLLPVEKELEYAQKNIEDFPSLNKDRINTLKKDWNGYVRDLEDQMEKIKNHPFENIPENISDLEDRINSLMSEVPAYSAHGIYDRPCKIKSKLNGYVLDVKGPENRNGALVHMWEPYQTDSQVWIFRKDGTIENKFSGRVLDIPAADPNAGIHLHIWDKVVPGTSNQRWDFEGEYIRSRLNGKVLDVEHESASRGTRVIMYDKKGGTPAPNQQWTLEFIRQ